MIGDTSTPLLDRLLYEAAAERRKGWADHTATPLMDKVGGMDQHGHDYVVKLVPRKPHNAEVQLMAQSRAAGYGR